MSETQNIECSTSVYCYWRLQSHEYYFSATFTFLSKLCSLAKWWNVRMFFSPQIITKWILWMRQLTVLYYMHMHSYFYTVVLTSKSPFLFHQFQCTHTKVPFTYSSYSFLLSFTPLGFYTWDTDVHHSTYLFLWISSLSVTCITD